MAGRKIIGQKILRSKNLLSRLIQAIYRKKASRNKISATLGVNHRLWNIIWFNVDGEADFQRWKFEIVFF